MFSLRESDVEEISCHGRKARRDEPGKGGLVSKGTEVEKYRVCSQSRAAVHSGAVETSLKSSTEPQRQ